MSKLPHNSRATNPHDVRQMHLPTFDSVDERTLAEREVYVERFLNAILDECLRNTEGQHASD